MFGCKYVEGPAYDYGDSLMAFCVRVIDTAANYCKPWQNPPCSVWASAERRGFKAFASTGYDTGFRILQQRVLLHAGCLELHRCMLGSYLRSPVTEPAGSTGNMNSERLMGGSDYKAPPPPSSEGSE